MKGHEAQCPHSPAFLSGTQLVARKSTYKCALRTVVVKINPNMLMTYGRKNSSVTSERTKENIHVV